MNWKRYTSVAFCFLTLLSAGCGSKSTDTSSSTSVSSTNADNTEKQKKLKKKKRLSLKKQNPPFKNGERIFVLYITMLANNGIIGGHRHKVLEFQTLKQYRL